LELKATLSGEYRKQIENFFGDPQKALEFLSGVVADVQRTPKLLECTPQTLINSYIMMAQLKFMPSKVSGEAYVLPYENRKGGFVEAQFQLGYLGLVTLLYRAGAKQVVAEIVRENDVFRIINGSMHHEVNPLLTKEERGEAIGAYAIITTQTGGTVEKFMRIEDILAHGKQFSKSFSSEFSPWNPKHDPEGWMVRKTVLKQAAKLAPKNEMLNLAIAEDNKDSVIGDRLPEAKSAIGALTMGNLTNHGDKNKKDEKADAGEDQTPPADGLPVVS
jgi:recombination protein RecT